MYRFKMMLWCAVTFAVAVLPSAAYAKASCWCRLGPTSSPYKDFGAIASFGGQTGHDSICHDLCSQTVASWMGNASNYNNVCQAAHWGSIAAYSCVGTRPWSTAWTMTCHSTTLPAAGSLSFIQPLYPDAAIRINNALVAVNNNTQQHTQITSTPLFTTFELIDNLSYHTQQWTYTAQLYRDNVLVEVLTKKSPFGSSLTADAKFTQQPNAFVHGHTWKIAWTYAGPKHASGASSYSIP